MPDGLSTLHTRPGRKIIDNISTLKGRWKTPPNLTQPSRPLRGRIWSWPVHAFFDLAGRRPIVALPSGAES
jgi:hypothetical protein